MASQVNLRDYSMPAIEQRIQELLKRRVSTMERGVPIERAREKLVCIILKKIINTNTIIIKELNKN